MKKLKIIIPALLLVLVFSSNRGLAQEYKTGIGLRGGPGYGVTIKHFTTSQGAVEGIISPRWNGVLFTGLYEKHAIAFDVNGLTYYGGIGAHVGFWNYRDKDRYNNPWVRSYERLTIAGIDLILGIEYTFKNIPFNIGLDWKPMLNLINDGSIWFDDVAFSLRFIPGNM